MRKSRDGSRSERPEYGFAHFVIHLAEASDWDRLFQLIEKTSFLADQARSFGGFQQGSRDLETYVLPAAMACATRDGIDDREAWPRFLHLALVAANLREMATALADKTILEALVRQGHGRLATDIADQLTDPVARAEARALIVGQAPEAPEAAEVLRRLEDDLEAVPPPEDEETAEAWLGTLCSLARLAGPELRHLGLA